MLRIPLEVGRTYNQLTVLYEFSKVMTFKNRDRFVWYAHVKCTCGREKDIISRHVRVGATQSCGCLPQLKAQISAQRITAAYVVRYSRMRAKKTGWPFTLTVEQVQELIFAPCAYCAAAPPPRGAPHSLHANRGREVLGRNGMDRVDPKGGYTPDNVVPCCHECNTAKLDKTLPEFRAYIQRVAKGLGLIKEPS